MSAVGIDVDSSDSSCLQRFRVFALAIFLALTATPEILRAQADSAAIEERPVHWAFATMVGTGWYKVEDGRRAFIVDVPLRQVVRESSLSDSGKRQLGIFAKYDAAVGFYSIDWNPGVISPDNVSTVSFMPGIEVEIPVTERWYLRPYANVGWGAALGESESAWIYSTGIKSRYRLDSGSGRLTLHNAINYAGYTPGTGRSEDLTGLFAGVEWSHPLGSSGVGNQTFDLHWRLGYHYLNDPAEFALRDTSLKSIGNTIEFGLALRRADRPFRLWFLQFDRVGLSYSVNSDGSFKSISLLTKSWFSR